MNTILALLVKYKYLILIPLSIPLGPEVNVPASFLASLGYLNVYVVYVIIVAGDLIGDGMWYWVARTGRSHTDTLSVRFGITQERIAKAEKHLRNHFYKTMFIGKATNVIMLPIIFACGALRIDYKKFLLTSLVLDLIKDFIFTMLGYYFGTYYQTIINRTHSFYLDITFVIAIALLVYVSVSYIRKQLSEAYEKDEI